MRINTATIATLFLLAAAPLSAQMSVKDYKAATTTKGSVAEFTKTYIHGLGEGLVVGNAIAQQKGRRPLFCPPPKLGLSLDNYLGILDRKIQERSAALTADTLDETPISVLLLMGLEDTFPCAAK